MSNLFTDFFRLLQQGDQNAWRKAFILLHPVVTRAAHVLGYCQDDAESIAFDSLSSLPGKILQFQIKREEDLRACVVTEVYLRCLPVLEILGTGPLGKWKEALVKDRDSTEREIFRFISLMHDLKISHLSEFEQIIFNDRWLMRKDRSTIVNERAIQMDQLQSILEKITRKMKSGLDETGFKWMLAA
ncbi:MAG: hypothetical protein HN548_01565 [Opitutae bacterium]|jgi:hypothetical protein|nr:hypothetical protein [Opitutae bacterium]